MAKPVNQPRIHNCAEKAVYNAPPISPFETSQGRRGLRAAWEALLDAHRNWQFFLTLNFNYPTNGGAARHKWASWLARVDKEMLGHHWQGTPSEQRTFAIAVVENPYTNLHLHVLLRLPAAGTNFVASEVSVIFAKRWQQLAKGGSCDVQAIRNSSGAVRYMTKQLHRPNHSELVMISTEFHSKAGRNRH
jgi:hypothetical protein